MDRLAPLLQVIWRSTKRALVFVVGVVLLVVGLVMLVTPGPGIVLVVAGLAVLATEFVWAEHLLTKARARAATAAAKVPGGQRLTALTSKVRHRGVSRPEPRQPADDEASSV